MCGIAGYYSLNRERIDSGRFKSTLDTLIHRGPDDFGYAAINSFSGETLFVEDPEAGGGKVISPDLILGHRRLSIIDLSPAGRQPMTEETGSFWIVYNGEIYNYVEVREELRHLGHLFLTKTDTEVILRAYAQWGEACLSKFNGMFAFALWDVKKRTLFCARDRMGVKPFYYYADDNRFIFASEIKAILAMGVKPEINAQIMYDYLSQGLSDHTEETFFHGIKQLKSGHYISLSQKRLNIQRWWDIADTELEEPSDETYAEKFLEIFTDSIRLRLRSDVPIGTCLSGGLDSSSIVCIANNLMFHGGYSSEVVGERQRTFSSCFEDRKYDERIFIEEVIKKTNAGAHYTFMQGKGLFDLLPKVIWHQDEPFGSTGVIAQWHVMKIAAENGIKVLLDGQGSDEIMAGYHLYFGAFYVDILKRLNIPRFVVELLSYKKVHRRLDYPLLASIAKAALPDLMVALLRRVPYVEKISGKSTIANAWLDGDFNQRYRREYPQRKKFRNALKNHLYSDLLYTRLPALLRYEDRNSMSFSLEARVPFLDYRLVEYVFSLPPSQKIRNGMTKVLLRNAMKGILPETVRTRSDKMGYETPESVWFRSILKDQITDMIESDSFRNIGYFNVAEVKKEFKRYCGGKRVISSSIWKWINIYYWEKLFIHG